MVAIVHIAEYELMNIDKKQLKIISLEFRTIANRLINCHWQTGMDLLRKFLSYVDDTEVIRDYVQSYVNPEDFKNYKNQDGTVYTSMGETKQEEISFTYQFLKYASENCKTDIYHYLAWGYANEANDAVKEFCTRIILPFVNYIEGYLTEIGIRMGFDETSQFTINVNGGSPQLNIVSGSGNLNATQNAGMDKDDLEKLLEDVLKEANTSTLNSEELQQITDSLEAIKSEMLSQSPKKGILRTALKGLQMVNGSTQFLAAVATIVQVVTPYIQ